MLGPRVSSGSKHCQAWLKPSQRQRKRQTMAVTDKAWEGARPRSDTPEANCASCLIDLNGKGEDKTQDNCKLPVKEPNGDINSNALGAAAAALAGGRGGVYAPAEAKRKAAN